MSSPVVSIEEIAVACDRSRKTVERWIAAGELPEPIHVGPSLRWRREDIEKWLADRKRRLAQNLGGNLSKVALGMKFRNQ